MQHQVAKIWELENYILRQAIAAVLYWYHTKTISDQPFCDFWKKKHEQGQQFRMSNKVTKV